MGSKARRSPNTVATTKSTLESPLLDSDAVAFALGVTRRHVQRLVAERRIPFLKIGRFVRFDPSELNVWLEQQRVEPLRSALRERTTWR
jgi:excisionase family DNA binding protein